jgi:hypothetical protein
VPGVLAGRTASVERQMAAAVHTSIGVLLKVLEAKTLVAVTVTVAAAAANTFSDSTHCWLLSATACVRSCWV